MVSRVIPYDELLARFQGILNDPGSAEGRKSLAEQLAELKFEVQLIKNFQQTLMAALRARDIVAQDRYDRAFVRPARLIELDPRDSFEASEGLLSYGWDGDVPYRWTGPGQDTILRVWLDRSIPVVTEVAVHTYGDPRNRGAVKLFADGALLEVTEVEEKLLRSEPFPVIDEVLYTEIRIHVPWLTGQKPSSDRVQLKRSGRRALKNIVGDIANELDDIGPRGISFTRLRFLAPT
jgi:hypothetical protein